MIILGLILLILGVVLGIGILTTIGVILLLIGAVLWLLGAAGRPIGGRAHYWWSDHPRSASRNPKSPAHLQEGLDLTVLRDQQVDHVRVMLGHGCSSDCRIAGTTGTYPRVMARNKLPDTSFR